MAQARFAGCSGRVASRGFTLIETLVALLVAAIGAAVVLSHVRTLMLRAEHEQAEQLAALQLLNDSLRLSHGGPPASPPSLARDELVLPGSSAGDWPTVRVRNFSVRGERLPPISIAYTPFQLFGVSRGRHAVNAIAAGMKPPESAYAGASARDSALPSPASAGGKR